VISEAVYVGIVTQPVLHNDLKKAAPVSPALTLRAFLSFYIPLAMTSLLFLISQPVGSAALSRMPRALESLAVWPVISGLSFMFRSPGNAFNEVVVALLDAPRSYHTLRRFMTWLVVISSAAFLLVTATPLSTFWLVRLSALNPDLVEIGRIGLWFSIPFPAMAVLQSWYQGAILHGRHTRGITEAVVIYLVVISLLLVAGVAWGGAVGLYVGLIAMVISLAVQTVWLWLRSKPVFENVAERDASQKEAGIISTPAD
jgi:hypothetical protein